MPTAATQQPTGTNGTRQGNNQQKVMPTVPFIRASALHREPTGIDVTKTLTTSDQDLGVFDIPAYGYVRNLVILVTASGGTGGSPAATLTENGVFAALKNIYLTEPNGAVIDQFDTAYELMLANKFGGYGHVLGADPKADPQYVNATSAFSGFTYMLRIPVEMNCRDGLGSLPNQNAAATFKLRMTLAKVADIAGGTLPTTLPNVRVRVYLEAWDQPEVNSAGATNQVTPPAMNTTQFWSSQTYNVNAGQNTIRLTRVGNYIRNLIFVLSRAGTSRANGESDWMAADPVYLYLDTRPLDIIEPNNWRNTMYRRSGYGATVGTTTPAADAPRGLENGVRVYDFMHEFDGTYGHENRDLWLPTLGSTRLELQFNAANAGTLKVLTNDVAIAGSVFI
jgi:hypothetical protein